MQIEAGKSYLLKSGKHAIDCIQVVQEPGRGSVMLCSYYNISEPNNTQMELYQLDGFYRLDRVVDENWDVDKEYIKPKSGELSTSFEGAIFDKGGRQIYPFVNAKALARLYQKGETIPIIKFSFSKDNIEGFVKLDVFPDDIVNEIIKNK